jgi:hypothetical protein
MLNNIAKYHKDAIGNKVFIGDKVAYNYSGEVFPGLIKDISYDMRGDTLKIKITNLVNSKESLIKTNASILKIEGFYEPKNP